jgi:hypothetical protein
MPPSAAAPAHMHISVPRMLRSGGRSKLVTIERISAHAEKVDASDQKVAGTK